MALLYVGGGPRDGWSGNSVDELGRASSLRLVLGAGLSFPAVLRSLVAEPFFCGSGSRAKLLEPKSNLEEPTNHVFKVLKKEGSAAGGFCICIQIHVITWAEVRPMNSLQLLSI